jgi:hypothetical protein
MERICGILILSDIVLLRKIIYLIQNNLAALSKKNEK